jgi:hypothetical protein
MQPGDSKMNKAQTLLKLTEAKLQIGLNYSIEHLIDGSEQWLDDLQSELQDKFELDFFNKKIFNYDYQSAKFSIEGGKDSDKIAKFIVNKFKNIKRAKVWVNGKVALDNFDKEVTDIEHEAKAKTATAIADADFGISGFVSKGDKVDILDKNTNLIKIDLGKHAFMTHPSRGSAEQELTPDQFKKFFKED